MYRRRNGKGCFFLAVSDRRFDLHTAKQTRLATRVVHVNTSQKFDLRCICQVENGGMDENDAMLDLSMFAL